MTLKINTNFKFLKSKIQQIFKKKRKRKKQANFHKYTHTHIQIYTHLHVAINVFQREALPTGKECRRRSRCRRLRGDWRRYTID